MEGMDLQELAAFLRTRREALTPADVGLAPGVRRRARGLRREEVALLANMSADYYSRLEQSRPVQPSAEILASVASALRLTQDERDYLFHLADIRPPEPGLPSEHVNPTLLRMLDQLDRSPAQVLTDLGEVLAQNRLAVALFGDARAHTGLARNVIYRWFTDPAARTPYPPAGHATESRIRVATLRMVVGRRGDARATALVAALRQASTEFAQLWDEQQVAERFTERKALIHPEVGEIELDCQTLLAASVGQILAVQTPVPGSSAQEKLDRLSVVETQRLTLTRLSTLLSLSPWPPRAAVQPCRVNGEGGAGDEHEQCHQTEGDRVRGEADIHERQAGNETADRHDERVRPPSGVNSPNKGLSRAMLKSPHTTARGPSWFTTRASTANWARCSG